MNFTNKEILKIAMEQSAIDASCMADDFLKSENIITCSMENDRARKYLELPFSCNLISYGNNIVASVKEEYRDIVFDYINKYAVEHCFETPNMHVLNDALQKENLRICFMAEYFLPDLNFLRELECAYELRVLHQEDFAGLYKEEWSNALCEKRKELDVLGIGAYDEGRLIGLAACSADCNTMWQIGIDVLPEYRRQGIASALTSRLALEILNAGKVPFYCAAWSNIKSVRNAIRSGFRPAWIEMTAKERAVVDEMNKRETEYGGGTANMIFPEKIKKILGEESYRLDRIGMSAASVFIFEDKVLKVQKCSKEAENEYRMMLWLQEKLLVPKVYAYETLGGKSYFLMSKLNGEAACDEKYMKNPGLQVKLLAKGLQNLWSIDITDCPSDSGLENKLAQAKYNVENNLVDLDNVEPDTFGEKGFKNPGELLKWLYDNKPEEELVLSHGDYCLPNVIFKDNNVGYIDLGKMGVADKWCDIALCYRSLSHNYNGRYNGQDYSGLNDLLLFEELGIKPDWEKIKYYILLDELF